MFEQNSEVKFTAGEDSREINTCVLEVNRDCVE